jgi:hypothetical protein
MTGQGSRTELLILVCLQVGASRCRTLRRSDCRGCMHACLVRMSTIGQHAAHPHFQATHKQTATRIRLAIAMPGAGHVPGSSHRVYKV